MVPNFLFDVQEGPWLSNKLSFYSEQLIFGKRQLLQISLRCCEKWMTFLKWTFDLLVPNFLFDVQEGRRQTYKVYFHSEQFLLNSLNISCFTEHLQSLNLNLRRRVESWLLILELETFLFKYNSLVDQNPTNFEVLNFKIFGKISVNEI